MRLIFLIISLMLGSTSTKSKPLNLNDAIDELASGLFSDKKPGGVILASKNGNIVYRKAFGKANLELGVDIQEHHVFGIASNTKPFTAVAILKLAEKGMLKLNDDIKQYLPNYPTYGETITIEHLLTHTSGINNYNDNFNEYSMIEHKHHNTEQMLALFKDKPLNFKPGDQFKYNNSAYFLLGLVIEKITQKPYQEYLKDEIFTPLNMHNTHFNAPQEIVNNRVAGYETNEKGFVKSRPVSLNFSTSAAGGIASTVDDMHVFYQALSTHMILNKESITRAFQAFTLNNGNKSRTGLGWFIGNLFGSPFISHDGRSWGYVSSMVYLPEEKIFVVALSNSSWYGYGSSIAYFPHKIAAMIADKPYSDASSNIVVEGYAGIYKSRNGDKKTIVYRDGRLYYQHHGHESTISAGPRANQFYIEDTFETLYFKQQGKQATLTSVISSPQYFKKQ